MDDPNASHILSRRRFLEGVALAIPGTALFGCGTERSHAELNAANAPPAPFLTADEKRFLDAAVERLIPGDASGVGARDAGVVTFLDRQLAGPYGMARTWYLRGPWPSGTKQQGYQSRMNPSEMYRAAIRDIQAWCRQHHGKPFESLSVKEQDAVLHGLDSGDIKLPSVASQEYFTILWNNTQQGYLADPMYGGNHDFAGWKLVGFPGPRYNYTNEIEQYGKPYKQPTVGLRGRGDLHRNGG